jgi:two-component system CheB/CheR fusion protein
MGRVIGIGGIKTDVTAIRQAERTAQEAVAQRDRFLATLSHELRNPLAAVLSAAEIAARSGPLSPDVANWLGVIGRRSRHMARLMDDLLDVARFTQNKDEIRKATIDLAATVPDVLEEVRPWFEGADLTLTREGPDGPLLMDGDPHRLQQVQVNLLRNAAKYTPAGGRVWYALGREDGCAVIRVWDTGVGLSAEMLGKVFEPFVQADETLDRAGGGIGVGLTLVRSIVERHGGTVEARSDGPGKGSEFVVRLPLKPAPEAPTEPTAVKPGAGAAPVALSAPRPALRVLVVEDDADIRASLVAILELEGHGYELARRIRARTGPTPHLVALTGYGRAEDRAAAAAAGFDAHLTKPYRPDELTRVLASIPESRDRCTGGAGA